jgi:hypothetical protein
MAIDRPSTVLALAAGLTLLVTRGASAQARQFPLESAESLRLLNVAAEPATLEGKKGLRLRLSDDAARRLGGAAPGQADIEQLASIEGVTFSNGVIEAEIAGARARALPEGARGFVGIAFRLQEDLQDLRRPPTCGRRTAAPRIEERRNHAAQYISHRLALVPAAQGDAFLDTRRTSISCREPDEDQDRGWGERAPLRARERAADADRQRRKSGANAKGACAPGWGPGTIAHFGT